MDSFRSISVVSIAHFVMLGAMAPSFADVTDEESDHRRHHGRSHAHAVSHSRADYPVIWNWLPSPDQSEPAAGAVKT
jgi:hypothetical protein